MSVLVHVAVGVVIGEGGHILIARRPDHVHQGGLWEFPGGKLGVDEDVHQALVRELREELTIEVTSSEPLIQIRHDYGDKQVLLDVRRVTCFNGQPQGAEGQPIAWVPIKDLGSYHFPAANRPIITALSLPQKMLITGSATSIDEYLDLIQIALEKGIGGVQLRCPDMPTADYLRLARAAKCLCNARDVKLILNCPPEIFTTDIGDGLHLNRHWLKKLQQRPVAENVFLGASCHGADELAQARRLGVDYVSLSPVLPTKSHRDTTILGWSAFAQLIADMPMPVYALGGLQDTDLPAALNAGAQGVAAISCWWNTDQSVER